MLRKERKKLENRTLEIEEVLSELRKKISNRSFFQENEKDERRTLSTYGASHISNLSDLSGKKAKFLGFRRSYGKNKIVFQVVRETPFAGWGNTKRSTNFLEDIGKQWKRKKNMETELFSGLENRGKLWRLLGNRKGLLQETKKSVGIP